MDNFEQIRSHLVSAGYKMTLQDAFVACVELSLGGPLPERIVVRFPGARRAWADGRPCAMDGETILAPADLRRLVIDRAPPP